LISLRDVACALGGEISGRQVLAPGPNHDPKDRSLSIKISAGAPNGFLVHSFAGDDFKKCRDYVRARLGIERHVRHEGPVPLARLPDAHSRIARINNIWRESVDPRGTIVERYLASRALELSADVAASVIRFHAQTPWRDAESEKTFFVPCMIAAMRAIEGDQIVAIHRTRLASDGSKRLERRMFGFCSGAAIKLDEDEAVGSGLHIGEGIETCLTARQLGLRPVWALGSTSFISIFPVLSGVSNLTILAENNEASSRAMGACAIRWHSSGREVLINRPTCGDDLNDAIRGAA
jgi:putative DNA primase/helicase